MELKPRKHADAVPRHDPSPVAAAVPDATPPPPSPPPPAPPEPAKKGLWPKGFDATKQGPGFSERIADDVWAVIHGENPAAIYDLRVRPRRPVTPGVTIATPRGDVGAFIRGDEHCPTCGCRVKEVCDVTGALRCLACGFPMS